MLSTQESNENKISEILTFDLNKNLEDLTNSKRFEIMPFDQIIIKKESKLLCSTICED